MKKLFAAVLSVMLVFSLVACGSSGGKKEEKKSDKMKGEEQTCGEISVFVPDGFTLSGGSITGVDDTDVKQCYMKKDPTSMFDYIWIIATDEETAENNIAMTKEVNSAEDITVSADNGEWKGCHYTYASATGDVDCGMLSLTVETVTYQISFCGYAADSAEMKAVLSSVKPA